jgi:hypothetical protein
MLGHAKASMTLDVYADLFDEARQRCGPARRGDPVCRGTTAAPRGYGESPAK